MTACNMPTHYWVPPYIKTFGPEVSDFCAEAKFAPDPEQRLAHDAIFARKEGGLSAAFEVALVCGRQNIKHLDVKTPILTGRGWVDLLNIRLHDEVYHPDGYLTRVVAVSTPELGHDCYRVTTTDGRSVVASGSHIWAVDDRSVSSTRRHLRELTHLTTRQIFETGTLRGGHKRTTVLTDGVAYTVGEYRYQLPKQHALKIPGVDLPLDPYLLGAWLGDGKSSAAVLHCHVDDVAHWMTKILGAGFVPVPAERRTCWDVSITHPVRKQSFQAALRKLNMLGDKHIPEEYLTAGTFQREALLQGLLDTDGTIHRRSGQVTYVSVLRGLAEGVLFLARSLGWRAGFREIRAVLNGRDYGPAYQVTFTPRTDDPYVPFMLPRKARLVRPGSRPSRAVSIKSVEPVATRAVRCLKVDAPDGLFLAGRDLLVTHNTGTEVQAMIGWAWLFDIPLTVYSAHEFGTAMGTFRVLCELIAGSPLLSREVRKIIRNHGEEGIELKSGARIIFRTRTAGGGRGLSGNKVVLDEGMFLQPKHMGALLPTLSAQPDPQVLYGSSAGMAISDVLRDVRDRGRAGNEPRLAYLEYCAPPPKITCDAGDNCTHSKVAVGCGCDKPDYWQMANPALGKRRANGTGITFEYVKAERRALDVREFCRERMGWWDEASEGMAPLPLQHWHQCGKSLPAMGSPIAVGVESSRDSAMSAIGIAAWQENGLPHVELAEHLPGTGWVVDRLMGIVERRHPVAVVFNPAGDAGAFERQLRNLGFVTAPDDQMIPSDKHRLVLTTGRALAQASGAMTNAVVNHRIGHPDQAPLNASVEIARVRPVADAFAFMPAPGGDITPINSVTLALHGLMLFGDRPPLEPFVLT